MSEGIIIALIGLAGAVIGAAITGFATIVAHQPRSSTGSRSSCGTIGLIASVGAAVGLVLGAILGVFLVQQIAPSPGPDPAPISSSAINLGSGWTPSHISPANGDKYRTYSHYPRSDLRYLNVHVDDDLHKVEKVCHDGTTDITHLFRRRGDITNEEGLPHYQSEPIERAGCRIDFRVVDNYGGNMGIDIIEAEPWP